MYLLNLTWLQFAAVFGSIAALAVALYLLDRSRRKLVVSTLRFWAAAEQPSAQARRRRISEPWSLILQLLSMALLLLALAQLRLGAPRLTGRDHVLILDVSAWMDARSGSATLMDLARDRASRYLHALPARDRVMLVRADALATPVTGFEPDRRKLEALIQASQPGATALNLGQALSFARHMQAEAGRQTGEIVFVGCGRTGADQEFEASPRNLRVLLVADAVENAGLRKIGTRRSATDPELWEIYVEARNYGAQARSLTLSLDFGPANGARAAAGTQQFTLAPGAAKAASFEYRARAAGVLGVTLAPHDAFPADDHAELELPAEPSLDVTVYTSQPDLLRPMLGAAPRLRTVYRRPEEYRPDDAGLVILDRFSPPQRPAADSIWIDPPAQGSPVPIRQRVEEAKFQAWNPAHPAATGLRARDFRLEKASVFEAAPDEQIGEIAAGPVIVARAAAPRVVVFGFHPGLSAMRFELATPLLFANLLRWLSPDVFRRWEISGASVGTIRQLMDQDTPESGIHITAADGTTLPFTLRDRTLDFFSGVPGLVRVQAGDRDYVYSLTLPQLGDTRWTPPADAPREIPAFAPSISRSGDVWPWLALLGAFGLLVEWLAYGRARRGPAHRFFAAAAQFRGRARKDAVPAEVRR